MLKQIARCDRDGGWLMGCSAHGAMNDAGEFSGSGRERESDPQLHVERVRSAGEPSCGPCIMPSAVKRIERVGSAAIGK